MIVAGQQGTPLVCPCRANGIAGIIPAHSVAPPSSNLVDMPVVVACGHIIKPPVVPLCAQLRFLSSFSSAQQHFVSAQQSYLTPLHFILILLFHTLTRLHIHTHTHTHTHTHNRPSHSSCSSRLPLHIAALLSCCYYPTITQQSVLHPQDSHTSGRIPFRCYHIHGALAACNPLVVDKPSYSP